VLVFPCASGVGQEIYNALKYHKDIQLYGANAGIMNPGSILYEKNYIGHAPPMSQSETCIDWLNNIIEKYHINCIFPAYDDAHVWFKTHENRLGGVKIITSPMETTQICRSKKITYDKFNTIIRCPALYSSIDAVQGAYPVFIKPECGEGSKGCHKIQSEIELIATITPEHIICEYLPGDEYTVDCFSDISGKLCFVGPRVRRLTRAGISILTETVQDENGDFSTMAQKINDNLRCVGAWFFQVKRATTGELCLMEIAPRIAGAMFLYRTQGVNFPLLSIYAHMGIPTTIIQPKLSSVIGCKLYTNNFYVPQFISNPIAAFYIDLDDTLILPVLKKVNPTIISLLYEAKQADIPIYLITRHKGIVDDTLNSLCIHKELFREIIHITDKTHKQSFMLNRPAILLDDSFSERTNSAADDIYMFDIDSYEMVRDILRISYAPSDNTCVINRK